MTARPSDHVAEFLAERTTPDPDGKVRTYDLRAAYRTWCQERGIRPLAPASLGAHLKKAGIHRNQNLYRFPQDYDRQTYDGINLTEGADQ